MSLSANRFYYTNTNHNDASNVLINFHNLTGNAEFNEHPLSKYARGLFFSPNYNKQFFDAINWANNLGIYKNQHNLINPLVNNVLMNIDVDDAISGQLFISHIVKMGAPITGEATGDMLSEYGLTLNHDGTVIAIGSRMNDGNGNESGHVRVYKWNGNSWNQLGDDIDGEAAYDRSGAIISLNNDGTILAIGAMYNDGINGSDSGHVRIYDYVEGRSPKEWEQMGADIDGKAANDMFGFGLSLNGNGNIIAIGASNNDGNGSNSGHVRVYDYDKNRDPIWKQMGDDIIGEGAGDMLGYDSGVSLSEDGTILAIGAHANDGNGANSGHVRIYKWDESNWQQLGDDIDGEAAGDNSGYSISLNADGTILAIGARNNTGINGTASGHVRVYKWNESNWQQLGNDIDGEASDDWFGWSVSLSSDGTTLAIGAVFNDGNGTNSGHVRVYQCVKGLYTSDWVQVGYDIDGPVSGNQFGLSVSLSKNGSVLAAGSPYNYYNRGIVYTYELLKQPITSIVQIGTPIDGEAAGDVFGNSVSSNTDGTIIAIGANGNDANGYNSGHVRVYKYNGSSWDQMGADIDGESASDESGKFVSLSSDGTIVAIGALYNDGNGTDSGHVRVYDYDETRTPAWKQIGADIDGEAENDNSGFSVSLSSDGTIVAIGARFNAGNGTRSGHVRVYKWNNSSWIQQGDDIDGEAAEDRSGWSVSLSADGTIVAIGAQLNDGNGGSSGHVRIYKWNNSSWDQMGNDIDGEAAEDRFGESVSLNADGTIVAIGARYNDGNDTTDSKRGHVRVYQYVKGLYTSDWVQVGYDLDGEAASNYFGYAVSLSKNGSVLVVGAYGYNSSTGRAYTYELLKQPTFKSIIKMDTPIYGYPHEGGQFGFSVSSNADGNVIAIGSKLRDNPLFDSGGVYIYKWEGNNWNNIGYIGGEGYYDHSGRSVSLNGDGTIVAIGAPGNHGNGGINSGHVRVHEYNGSTWDQLGQDIDGEAENDTSGYSVSLSDDGTIVAIGAPQHDGAKGHVRVYKYNGSIWQQRGNDIDGEAAADEYGQSISLSVDGTIVAIGSHKNNSSRGHVRVHKWDGSSWQQIGDDIDGEAAGDHCGWSVSLNGDGTIVAIGAIKNDGINGPDSGHVRVYDYVETRNPAWKQLGSDIDGESSSHYGDWSGFSVSLSADGTIVAIGSRLNDVDPATDSNRGSARVYQYVKGLYTSDWVQVGYDIDGEVSGDHLGYSISLSKNGSTLVVASPFNSNNSGVAYTYEIVDHNNTVEQNN